MRSCCSRVTRIWMNLVFDVIEGYDEGFPFRFDAFNVDAFFERGKNSVGFSVKVWFREVKIRVFVSEDFVQITQSVDYNVII